MANGAKGWAAFDRIFKSVDELFSFSSKKMGEIGADMSELKVTKTELGKVKSGDVEVSVANGKVRITGNVKEITVNGKVIAKAKVYK